MIAYSEDTYTFLNYKDVVSDMATLLKVTSIEKRMVETPILGENSVIVWNTGTVKTSGSPKPGGVIYLQNDYVAIDYEDSTEFKVIASASYKYNKNFSQLFPTKHQSTPLARAMGVNPESLIFVRKGVIAKYPDIKFGGLEADYVAIDDGEYLSYYGVKEQVYFGLPLPSEFNRYTVLGLAKTLSTNKIYQTGEATTGLCLTPAIKSKIAQMRTQLHSYKHLEVDWNLITAFRLPISDSMLVNGAVLSALKASIARTYLEDKIKVGSSINGLVAGIVLSEESFNNMLLSGINKDNLEDYILTGNIGDSVAVLLRSDFNGILEHYKLMYDIAVGNLSVGALIKLRADCQKLAENLSLNLESYFKDYILRNAKLRRGWESVVIDNKTSFVINLTTLTYALADKDLNIKFDSSNHELAQSYFAAAQNIVECYGADGSVTNEVIEAALQSAEGKKVEELDQDAFALDFIGSEKVVSNKDDSVAFQVGKLFARRRADAILQGVKDFNPSEFRNRTVKKGVEEKKVIGVWWRKIRWKTLNIGGNESLEIDYFPCDKTVKITKMDLSDEKAVISGYVYIPDFDSDISAKHHGGIEQNISELKDQLKGAIAPKFSAFGQVAQSPDSNVDIVWGSACIKDFYNNPAWGPFNCSLKEARSASGEKADITIPFQVIITRSSGFSNLIALASFQEKDIPQETYELATPEEAAIIKRGVESALKQKNMLREGISTMAAAAAYEECKLLLANVSENYEFDAIGAIGSNYQGVIVNISDLAKVCAVDEAYVAYIIKLIDGIKETNQAMYDKLTSFKNQMIELSNDANIGSPITYISRAKAVSDIAVDDPGCYIHYLLGGFNV